MFLTDEQLRARLNELQFQAEAPELAFDKRQIGPCSVDLKLSQVYWRRRRIRRRSAVDLDRTHLMELSPTRGWTRHVAKPGERITLRPGDMVLGRVAEAFRMPSDCAGLIEGRSSYARLGLSVHATGAFINPGWRGHMPLTLVNHSPVTLRVPVGTPLCQLLVVPLAVPPDRSYADRDDRKYFNDQGGPSYWWREAAMRELRERLSAAHMDSRVLSELDELFDASTDESVLARLEAFLDHARLRQFGGTEEMLDAFAMSERWSRLRHVVTRFLAQWAWTIPGGGTVTVILGDYRASTRAWWTVGLLAALCLVVWSLLDEDPAYLTPSKLAELRKRRAAAASADSTPPSQ